MKKIIKKGTRDIRECESCGCLFSFDEEDIEITRRRKKETEKYVICPQCDHKVIILSVMKKESPELAELVVPVITESSPCESCDSNEEPCWGCDKYDEWKRSRIVL